MKPLSLFPPHVSVFVRHISKPMRFYRTTRQDVDVAQEMERN